MFNISYRMLFSLGDRDEFVPWTGFQHHQHSFSRTCSLHLHQIQVSLCRAFFGEPGLIYAHWPFGHLVELSASWLFIDFDLNMFHCVYIYIYIYKIHVGNCCNYHITVVTGTIVMYTCLGVDYSLTFSNYSKIFFNVL